MKAWGQMMEDPKTMEDTNPQAQWETVCEQVPTMAQDVLERIRVDSGWLYRASMIAGASTKSAGQVAVALAFVPDRQEP
jgi:hypothetical protein